MDAKNVLFKKKCNELSLNKSENMGQIFLNVHLGLKIKGKVLRKNFPWLCQNKNIWAKTGNNGQI